MPRPDFIVIGAMKCATSTVCSLLEHHPGIDMVSGHDPDFFSHDDVWSRGFDWYEGLFLGSPEKLQGEGSNSYTWNALYPDAPQRIKDACPNAKLIYMVRDPVHRTASAYVQIRTDSPDQVPSSIDQAVSQHHDTLVDPSLYHRQLAPYLELFGREQIFVGFVEDLKANQAAVHDDILKFLGLDSPAESGNARQDVRANPSSEKRVPNAAYDKARQVPFYKTIKNLVPEELRRGIKERLFTASASEAHGFTDESLASLRNLIRPDAERFLAEWGKPKDFWPLTPRL